VVTKIDRTEFGFIHDDRFGTGNEWIAFDNSVELDIWRYGIYLDLSANPTDYLLLRVSADLTPSASVDITQETRFKPLVDEDVKFEESTTLDFSYKVLGEVTVKTPWLVSFGGEYSYEFFPLNYDIKMLSQDSGQYFFQTSTVDTETETKSWILKLIFNIDAVGGMNPSIGFGNREITSTNLATDSETTTDEQIIRFGFEKRF
jgi:hypothetical protein